MINMFLSIIIPIYNVEQYIESCFNSLLDQDLDESLFEVIAVNDGTQDNSMVVVKRFTEKMSNIRILNKINGGVSSARNMGINHAKGDYIIFLDPDDFIAKDSLSKIYIELSYLTAELIILRSFFADSLIERYSWKSKCAVKTPISGVEVFKKGYSRGSVWGCVFRRSYLVEYLILFSEKLVNGEDSLFFNIGLLYASSVCFLDLPFYYISIREGSASRNLHNNRIFDFANNMRVVSEFIDTHAELTNEQKGILYYVEYTIISSAVNHFTSAYNLNYRLLKKKLSLKDFLPINEECIFIQKSKVKLINKSFLLYFSLALFKNICKK